ncbi:MAG: T9SS type A sorting domain-containing protein, partial [Candidatus Cloacimonadota bacterium]
AYYGFVDAPYNSKRALGAYYYPPVGIKEGYTQKIQIGHRINISPTISHQKPFIINYSFPEQTEISVSVYDITGRLVKNVYKGKIRGTGKISFTLKGLHQGVYFTRIESKNFNETTKIIWLR